MEENIEIDKYNFRVRYLFIISLLKKSNQVFTKVDEH